MSDCWILDVSNLTAFTIDSLFKPLLSPRLIWSRNVFSSFPQGLNQDMNMIKPTYDQFIIKPPARNKTHGQRATRLIVDSRERNR